MRLGFDAKRLFCNFTGLGNFSRTLVQDLARFHPEHAYHLYTPILREHPHTRPFLQDTRFTTVVPTTFFRSWWRSYGIVQQLQQDHIQLYHGLSHELPVGLARTGIKGVVTIHDIISKVHPEWYAPLERLIYDRKVRYSCQHADRIIAISEHTKQDLVAHYAVDPAKVEVIYQACAPLFYQRQAPEQVAAALQQIGVTTPYLLSVGSIEPRKNLKTLIQAYQHLPKDLHIPLVIVGRGGKYKQQVEHVIRQAGLERLVQWHENLTDTAQLQALYQGAAALVYPSFYEGFGLPVTEALLCKTPVITAATSALPEAGGTHSLYIDPTSAEHLARAIEQVVTDSAHAHLMREQGYAYAHQRFAAARLAAQTMQCYQRV